MLGAITSTYPIYARVKTHGESKVQRGCFEATQLVDDGKGKIPRQFFALASSPVVDSLSLSFSRKTRSGESGLSSENVESYGSRATTPP